MKERPLIVTTDLIPKILDGTKTKTRRVIKPQPTNKQGFAYLGNGQWRFFYQQYTTGSLYDHIEAEQVIKCPYGQAGDRLWVREKALYWDGGAGGCSDVVYANDPEIPHLLEDNNRLLVARITKNAEAGENVVGKWQWKPSIYMWRWASRITLEITNIRVERLQQITEPDCIAEGCPDALVTLPTVPMRAWYGHLWDSLNAKRGYPWGSNPFVWVIEFMELPKE